MIPIEFDDGLLGEFLAFVVRRDRERRKRDPMRLEHEMLRRELSRTERAGLIAQLANLEPYPESVPINDLVRVEGTPLADTPQLDPFEFVRTIAVARITMPTARVRLSAGRQQMGEAIQALCFMAGANSIFYGDKLLTTGNPDWERDQKLLAKLGLTTC